MRARARDVALATLKRVATQGAFASHALRAALESAGLEPADIGLATELVYGVLRRRGHLDRALSRAAKKRLKDLDPHIHDVLRLAAYQIMFLDRVPDHAAVDEAVAQAKERRGARGAAQVNAILRNLARTAPAERLPAPPPLEADPIRHVAMVGGLPEPLAALLVSDLGAPIAREFALASLEPAPLTLRVNRLRTTRAELMTEIGGTAGSLEVALFLPPGVGLPAELPCVRDGRATTQDEASMRVVELLDPRPGERVLDLCAAPGGKTTAIAERMGDRGEIVAHDRLPDRLALVESAADRLGLSSIEVSDVPPAESATFDRVLVDAPCSGLGTLRRHPEIRWRFSSGDLPSLTRAQDALLREGARHLRPGGALVYSVCTMTRAEGEERIAAHEGDLVLEEILRTGPHQEGAPDGFFAARLRRPES